MHVEQDDVDRLAPQQTVGGRNRRRLEHAVALQLEVLPPLQYALHAAAEVAHGIEPPAGAEAAHAELAASLAAARDATAELAETLESDGLYGVEPLLPEWRG